MAEERNLKQTLNGWQIFFIVITVVIGSGCFTDFGVVARTAGPPGLLVAVIVVGVIAVCAMEGLSEMIQLFPTVNPIVELVHEFVDEDLALTVGVAYWYTYASFLTLQVMRAASYLNFFVDADDGGWLVAKITLFCFLVPGMIVLINCCSVEIFGIVESIGGGIKMLLLLIIVFMLYQITGAAGSAQFFTQGIHITLKESHVPGNAVCLAIEAIAFSFSGIESMAVTAFEAKDSIDLRIPSKLMAYVVFCCYFILAIATSLCLNWGDAHDVWDLVDQYFPVWKDMVPGQPSSTPSAIIVAALKVGEPFLAKAMNGIFVFCAISAANSTLYVSSRMMYGMAYMNLWRKKSWINKLASVERNGVPRTAVLVSAASFCLWLPFTQIRQRSTTLRLESWFFNAGDMSIFFMWACISLAYIRYWFAFRKFQDSELLRESERTRFRRHTAGKGFSTFLDWMQPLPAFIGLIGAIFMVWVFPSSIFWGRSFTAGQFIEHYSMPLLLPILFLTRKAFVYFGRWRADEPIVKQTPRRWWHEFDEEERLLRAIEQLSEFAKPSQQNEYMLNELQISQEPETPSAELPK